MTKMRYIRSLIIATLAIFICAYVVSAIITKRIDREQRDELLKEAHHASLLLSAETISELSGTALDLSNPVYLSLKDSFTKFRTYNPLIRFVYILGYKSEVKTQFFYVDSEPTNSSEYSPPGQLFTDTRIQDINNYLKGEPYTDGPYNDSWGEWVSGYAPIKDSAGNVIALVGVDMATSVWRAQLHFVQIVIFLIAVLLSILIALFISSIYKRERSIDTLRKQNQNLSQKETKFKEMQSMAQLGKIIIYFPEETFSFDEQFAEILSLTGRENINKKTLLSYIHPDDHTKFLEALEGIINSDISYTWVDVRIGDQTKGFRLYHIYGNIDRNELLAPIRFSGIIQDITDIHS